MNLASGSRFLAADLHIHSCLSPCADVTMVPSVICTKGLDVLAITDHNSARNVATFVSKCTGATVVPGLEVHTVEDVHILTYFPTLEAMNLFVAFLDANFERLPYDPEKFGYELVLDENENFVESLDYFLGFPTGLSVSEVVETTKRLGGLPVFAHVDRRFGALHQLGILPTGTNIVEVRSKETYLELKKRGFVVVTNSDAHVPEDVGLRKSYIEAGETEVIISAREVLRRIALGKVKNIWEM